ncbi:MAG: YicC/YloC family endoribonuclease [Planctomycetota bacterium]
MGATRESHVIRSMTGFGGSSAEVGGRHLAIELRSLNHKFFKCSIRLPEEFQTLEGEMESVLRSRLRRGSVTLAASIEDDAGAPVADINPEALEQYILRARQAPSIASGAVPLDAAALLALPGVLVPPPDEADRQQRTRQTLLQLAHEACDALEAMRAREGASLHQLLLDERAAIAERLATIASRAPEVVRAYELRLRTRIESLLQDAGMQLQPVELVREIAAYAERTDIAEEVTRLGAHIEQFGEMIASAEGAPIGRTMDFLAQEMLREANTIASKSPDSEIAKLIVEVKGSIDRIKEQVQNVE